MGCPAFVIIGNNLKFSICTHDPDTGVLTDADAIPKYRIYEDEDEGAILNGDMDSGTGVTWNEFDDGNTVGFYVKQIACTAANGFENGKTYSVYIEATVDGDTGGISYEFTAYTSLPADTAAIKAAIEAAGSHLALIKAKTDNQPSGVKKGVALDDFEFLMVDSTDHLTPKIGLVITAQISKDGGAFAGCANAAAEVGSGVYKIDWTAAEANADIFTLKFTAPGADQRTITIKTSA